jgi:hypothetical protein
LTPQESFEVEIGTVEMEGAVGIDERSGFEDAEGSEWIGFGGKVTRKFEYFSNGQRS